MGLNLKRSFTLPFKGKKALTQSIIWSLIIFSGFIIKICMTKFVGDSPMMNLYASLLSFFVYLFPLGYFILLAQKFISDNDNDALLPDIDTNLWRFLIIGLKSFIATFFYTVAIFTVCFILLFILMIPVYFLLAMLSLNNFMDFVNKNLIIIVGIFGVIALFLTIATEAFISVVFANDLKLSDCFQFKENFSKMHKTLPSFAAAAVIVFLLAGVVFLVSYAAGKFDNIILLSTLKLVESFAIFALSITSLDLFAQVYRQSNS